MSQPSSRCAWLTIRLRIVSGSLAVGFVVALLLVAAPFIPAQESRVTGAVLCGFAVGWLMYANGNNYLRSVAQRDGNNLTDERQSAYAMYLLTRQGQRMAAEVAAARKRLAERYRGQWEKDLTAAWLAATLDLMRQDRDADDDDRRHRPGVLHPGRDALERA